MNVVFQLLPHMISDTGIIAQLNERKRKKEKNPSMTVTNSCQFTEETKTQEIRWFLTHGAFKTVSKLLRQQVTWHHLAFQLILGGGSREVYGCEKHTDFFYPPSISLVLNYGSGQFVSYMSQFADP